MLGSGNDSKMLYNKFSRGYTDVLYNIYNLLWACSLVVLYNMSVAGYLYINQYSSIDRSLQNSV